MALYAVAFLGSTPIGSPLVGAIAQWSNPRVSILVGAAATVVAAGLLALHHRTVVAVQPSAAAGHVAEVRGVEGSASQVA